MGKSRQTPSSDKLLESEAVTLAVVDPCNRQRESVSWTNRVTTRVKLAMQVLLGCVLLLSACTSSGPGNPIEPIELTDFDVRGVRHTFGAFANQQVPSAPCLGISLVDKDGSVVSMACPADESQVSEYAAAIELETGHFVVGYGLKPGEKIAAKQLTQANIVRNRAGDAFFVIRLSEPPGPEPIELIVTAPSGETRTIMSHGLSQ